MNPRNVEPATRVLQTLPEGGTHAHNTDALASLRLALTAVLAACTSVGDRGAPGDNEWGSGIVRHEVPAPALVSGPRIATLQSMAAGQWDGPEQMYAGTCGGCHGKGVGPHILGQALPEAYIRYVGRNGLRAMPPFRVTDYTDADLATLATWINA